VLREWQLEDVLGVGGFGIVYKAKGIYFGELVAIKEYFPSSISERDAEATVVPIDSDAEEVHALGLKILRAHAPAVGLKPSFSILDPGDIEPIVAELLQTTDRTRARAAQWKISGWKNALVSADAAAKAAQNDDETAAALAYRRYDDALRAYQAVDFDDLIVLPNALLAADSAVAAKWREQLLYGVGLQRVGRPVSAARVFDRAARRYPNDIEAQVAGAVGRFDKDAPAQAFGRLGPLSGTHPNEPTVRFHLGVLLLWTGRVAQAERQFRLAARTQPGSPLAREAARYLETIRRARG